MSMEHFCSRCPFGRVTSSQALSPAETKAHSPGTPVSLLSALSQHRVQGGHTVPAGPIWPAACLCVGRELRMVFHLKRCKSKHPRKSSNGPQSPKQLQAGLSQVCHHSVTAHMRHAHPALQ